MGGEGGRYYWDERFIVDKRIVVNTTRTQKPKKKVCDNNSLSLFSLQYKTMHRASVVSRTNQSGTA